MKHALAWSAALLSLAIAAPCALAGDDEKPVKPEEVPKAVKDAVEKKYPKCDVKEWSAEADGGKTVYEAAIRVAGKDKDGKDVTRKIDVLLSAEGKIKAEEERIAQDALPDDVKKGWAASKYAKAKVTRVERIVKDEKDDDPQYEVGATLDDKKVEVVLDKAGKIVHEESDDEEDEKPAGMDGGMDGAAMDGGMDAGGMDAGGMEGGDKK